MPFVPEHIEQGPVKQNPLASGLAGVLYGAVEDAVKAVKGEMTEDEAKMFFASSIVGLMAGGTPRSIGSHILKARKEFDEFAKKNTLTLTEDDFKKSLKTRAGQISRDLTEFNKRFPDEAYAPREELRQIREYLRESK